MSFQFDMFRVVTINSFDSLAEFRDVVEAQIQEVSSTDRSRILTEFKSYKPEDREGDEQLWAEQRTELEILDRKFATTFSRINRYSFLTMLFMYVETNLKAVCDRIAIQKRLKQRLPKVIGKALLHDAQAFLVRRAGLTSELGKGWESFENLRMIRNCIVHARGRVADVTVANDKAGIERLIQLNVGLTITPPMFPNLTDDDPFVDADGGLLQIEPVFCVTMLDAVKSAFEEIFEKAGCFGPNHVVRVD